MGAAKRVAERHLEAMAKILVNAPPPFDWGFYSEEEEPRMHLQTMDPGNRGAFKYFLERDGRRVLEPVDPVDAKTFKQFAAHVRRYPDRIEGEWVTRMIHKRWLTMSFDGRVVVLTAYPSLGARSIRRVVDVQALYPGLPLEEVDPSLDASDATLVLSRRKDGSVQTDRFIPHILWEGTR